MKISKEYIINSYSQDPIVDYYVQAVDKVGLWESEKIIIKKYIRNKNSIVLDLGCGTGRVTFGLYELGFKQIMGLDITPAMIRQARKISKLKKYSINFLTGDALDLPFKDCFFDLVIFAFNGLMQIPQRENRIRAMSEVCRVLKPEGYFIFTSHTRNYPPSMKKFWQEETRDWKKNRHLSGLYEFGDIFITMEGIESYLHIPDRPEVKECIRQSGLVLIEDIWRRDICKERKPVKDMSTENRFWITRK